MWFQFDFCSRESWVGWIQGKSLNMASVEVKIILTANSFNQCLQPVQSLQKIYMRGKTSAQGSHGQSLRTVDELDFPFFMLINRSPFCSCSYSCLCFPFN